LSLWQNLRDHKPADFMSLEDNRHLTRNIVILAMPVAWSFTRTRRLGINLDVSLDEIDDPVNRDLGSRVNLHLGGAVTLQGGVGNLDDESYLMGMGMAILVMPPFSPNDNHIRLWLAILGRDGFLRVYIPTIRKQPCYSLAQELGGKAMRRILGHLRDEPSFKEFYRIVVRQDTSLDNPVVLLYREPPDREGWDHQVRRARVVMRVRINRHTTAPRSSQAGRP
jgi:hypothetical protein